MSDLDIVNINIGGTLFSTRFSTLKSLPDTRLGKLSTSSEEYIKEKGYFFFDRNPDLFHCLLDLYRHGNLHVPSSICGATLKRELEFWEIPLCTIPHCCLAIICKYEEATDSMKSLKSHFASEEDEATNMHEARRHTLCVIRHHLWLFLTSRNSSRAAKVFNVIYYLLVILSVMIFILGTHPAVRDPIEDFSELWNNDYEDFTWWQNVTFNSTYDFSEYETNPKMIMYWTTDLKPSVKAIDTACTMFFAVELILRMLCCPSVLRFLRSILNWLDIIITLALLTAFVMERNISIIFHSEAVFWLYVVCDSLIILRIVRLFRLTRDVEGIRVLTIAVKTSTKQLLMLGATVLVAMVLFSSVMYYIELNEGGSSFTTIPYTIWWSIITVTTVGYGDATPSTAAGYIIGGLCAVCGILLFAMPIAIVATTFDDLSFLNRVRNMEVKLEKNSTTKMSEPIPETKMIVNKVHVNPDTPQNF